MYQNKRYWESDRQIVRGVSPERIEEYKKNTATENSFLWIKVLPIVILVLVLISLIWGKDLRKTVKDNVLSRQPQEQMQMEQAQKEDGVTEDGLFAYHAEGDEVTINKYLGEGAKDIVIPNEIAGRTKIKIGNYVFQDSEITSVEMSDNVVEIGQGCFKNCQNLTKAHLSTSLIYIPGHLFRYDKNLTEVTMGEGIEEISGGAFYACSSLNELVIPKSVKKIWDSNFDSTGITEIMVSEGCEVSDFCNNSVTVTYYED